MCGYSRNGGRDWEIVTSLPMTAGRATPGGGMPMLTGWNYYVRGMEHILAVTDFAGWFSRDGGESWRFSPPADTPWHNNIYAIAFDPDDRRHWWAAVSLKHDLPYWHMMIHQDEEPTLWRGGVIETRDGGESWSVIAPEDGTIPDLPVTDILYDERRDCLWIAVLGSGIFRGDRRGGRWSRVSTGLPEENRNAFRLVLSPAGELYTVIIPRWLRESRTVEAGSCFRFDGSLGKWDRLPLPPELAYPVHLTFSADGTRMYLACFEFEREVPPPPGSDYPPPGLWAAAADGTGAEKLFTGFPVYMYAADSKGQYPPQYVNWKDGGEQTWASFLNYRNRNPWKTKQLKNIVVCPKNKGDVDSSGKNILSTEQWLWRAYGMTPSWPCAWPVCQ